ncbi:MAG: DUF4838 domain-containing protein [Lentisphaeria bacterium]|nr:DUF4838 domain-containing protein [Lentisphaeria bacterium]
MKHFLLLVCAAALLLSGCRSVPENVPPIELRSTSSVRIVIPAEHANPGIDRFLKDAAAVIQQGLAETLGIKAKVEIEGKSGAFKGTTIFLGNTRAIRGIGIEPLKFENFNAVIATRGGDIFIAGSDRQRFGKAGRVRHNSDCVLGTITGTVRFVEQFLNGRFLLPGVNGTDFVRSKMILIAENLTLHITPRIIMGAGRANGYIYDYSNANPGYGKFRLYGGHSYYDAVPAKKYAKSNPEYFVERSGKRSALGNHLCISNPQVQELIYKEMLKKLDEGAEAVELAQTDGFTACLCEKCKAFGIPGEDFGEKIWILHRALAERLMTDRPGKKVVIICYPPNFDPPKSFKEFPANTMIELCKYSEKTFADWKKIKVPGGFLVYIYNWGNYHITGYTPKCPPSYIAKQVNTFLSNGVKGIYRCGFGELFGLEAPVYYIFGKLLENPSLNYEKLLLEFYERAYHESAAPMRSFFEALHHALELMPWIKETRYLSSQRHVFGTLYNPELMDNLNKNLTRAEKLAVQPKVKKRLALVRAEFEYLKSIVDVIQMYRAYRTAPSWQTFELLAAALDARNALVDKMTAPKGRVGRFNDFPEVRFFDGASKAWLLSNGRSSTLGAPFNWDTKMLREKKILPGTIKKRMTIKKVNGVVEFNDFENGVWKDLKWEELGGIQLGAINEKSRFKAAYDDKNFYIGIVSDLDPRKTFHSLGNDGPCWRNDCIEILLDPQGMRQSFYHMIYTPAKESRFDEAFGFITDPLHPLYNKHDTAWNGKWSYACRREGDKWYSLFTVPFSELKVPTPKPGNVWTLNIGRESRIIGGSGNEVPELSLWSPNLENAGFHDREAFGEALFE